MTSLYRIIKKLPLPKSIILEWERGIIERSQAKEMAVARKSNDRETVEQLKHSYQFEMELHQEDEDSYLTRKLLSEARRLRVSIPHRTTSEGNKSDYWYTGRYTGGYYLTDEGITALRSEIRNERKARHEERAKWVVWLSATTGLIGTITALVALLIGKA